MSRLLTRYRDEIVPTLKEELGVANAHQVPRLIKVVINVGVGRAVQDSRHLDVAVETIRTITGQQPVITRAKKSIAGFKIREKNPIGVSVTLRGDRMYDFVDRLISIALPRVRDFRGISADSFDQQGNYALGIRESSIFPELAAAESRDIHGLQVILVTTAQTKEEAELLLRKLGFPLKARSTT
jgi:large subunit ribosomal protein L5